MFVDSHCHLNNDIFKEKISQIIKEAEIENIKKFLSIGVDYESSLENLNIKKRFKNVLISIGLHPNYVNENYVNKLNNILKLFSYKNVDAVGEIGLDFYRNTNFKKEQIDCLEKQLNFASREKKPVIIHTRDSFKETLNILKNYKDNRIIIHCFTGDKTIAKKFLDINCYISFSGIITFKNSYEICEAAKIVPLNKILIETDSPYLSPDPVRGKTNFPKNLKYIASKLSFLKDINVDELEKVTTKNFNDIFYKK